MFSKHRAAFVILSWLYVLPPAYSQEPTNFSSVKKAIVQVVAHHFSELPPKGRFSITMYQGLDELKDRELPDGIEAAILKEIGALSKLYVKASTLTFPSDDEERKLRKIQDSEGGRVSVLTISSITYVDDSTLLVSWDFGSGFLSGHGGNYKVWLEEGEMKVTRGRGGYDR